MGTTASIELTAPIITGRGIRCRAEMNSCTYSIITITEGSKDDVVDPEGIPLQDGDLKYSKGDQVGTTNSKTYVVYSEVDTPKETLDFDIINLKPQTLYTIAVYELADPIGYNYNLCGILEIQTGFIVNDEKFNITVYDNRTRLPIEGAEITFTDVRKFTSDFGTTDKTGRYLSIPMEEGRYEMNVSMDDYISKTLPGLFVQREEPRRDAYYRIFTSAGNTEIGASVERKYYKNKNEHIVFLDPIGSTGGSYTRYRASSNPSNITKL